MAKKVSTQMDLIHYGFITAAIIGMYHYLGIHAVHAENKYIIGLAITLIVADKIAHKYILKE